MKTNLNLLQLLQHGESADTLLADFKEQLANAEIEYKRQQKKEEEIMQEKAYKTFATTLADATIALMQTLAPDLTIDTTERRILIDDAIETAKHIHSGIKAVDNIVSSMSNSKEEKTCEDPITKFLRECGL